jgi:hypothetical protein
VEIGLLKNDVGYDNELAARVFAGGQVDFISPNPLTLSTYVDIKS